MSGNERILAGCGRGAYRKSICMSESQCMHARQVHLAGSPDLANAAFCFIHSRFVLTIGPAPA
jgi:hypothetical protein